MTTGTRYRPASDHAMSTPRLQRLSEQQNGQRQGHDDIAGKVVGIGKTADRTTVSNRVKIELTEQAHLQQPENHLRDSEKHNHMHEHEELPMRNHLRQQKCGSQRQPRQDRDPGRIRHQTERAPGPWRDLDR